VTFEVEPGLLVAFLLAFVRASAWLTVAPPFSTRGVPLRVRAGLAAALAVVLAPQVRADMPEGLLELAPFISAVVYQVVVGVALGFVVVLLFTAFQAGGELVDFFSGFGAAQLFDPFSNSTATPVGRVYQLLTTAILFAINGHLLLVHGFVQSFRAAPLAGLQLDALGDVLTRNVALFVLAGIEVAAPLLAALFLAEVVLGLLAKAAPQMNVLVFGFTMKIGIVLLLAGVALPLLPEAISATLGRALQATTSLGG